MNIFSDAQSLSSDVQLVAQAINNASARGDMPCLSLAKAELERLCARIDALERASAKEKHENASGL